MDKILGELLIAAGSVVLIFSFIKFFFKKTEEKGEVSKDPAKKSVKGKLLSIPKILLIFAVFPIYCLFKILKPTQLINEAKVNGVSVLIPRPRQFLAIIGSFFAILAVTFVIFPLWIFGYVASFMITKTQLGYVEEETLIAGTGSMYPTFPKGQSENPQEQSKEVVDTPGMFPYPNGLFINGKRFFNYELSRGDIVIVENDRTRELSQKLYGDPRGWVKRVIALAGDTLDLKDGIVYLNNNPLREPYTAKARSTFGEAFLAECKKYTIPPNSIFIMGDNRKGSGDSREIGSFDLKDVNHVLPLEKQRGILDKNWRDTARDFEESSKIKLDKNTYLGLLNIKREEAGVSPLKYQKKLESSASKRGEVIIKYDDFSWEATRSGYTMIKAVADSGYSNILYGEAPIQGYYEADELVANQFEFPKTKEFLLNKDYQEIGISEVEGEINGCPTQVIVQHFAGYVPPNYKKDDIESWRKVLNNLNSVIPSWEKAIGWENLNQTDLQHLLDLFYRERAIASNILAKMDANQWLSQTEEESIKEYSSLNRESSALTNKLNGN